MGLRGLAPLLVLLALAPRAAWAQEPVRPGEHPEAIQLDAVFAYNIETFSFGVRLHPRLAIPIWRSTSPPPATRPTHGTFEFGVFAGWSQTPAALYEAAMMSGDGTLDGSGANHVLVLASAGSTLHTESRQGHDAQLGIHLLGGGALRHERAHVTYERHGIDATYEETAHGALLGFVTKLAILFRGQAGPTFEASYFPLATHRGLAHWHVGLGLSLRYGLVRE